MLKKIFEPKLEMQK